MVGSGCEEKAPRRAARLAPTQVPTLALNCTKYLPVSNTCTELYFSVPSTSSEMYLLVSRTSTAIIS